MTVTTGLPVESSPELLEELDWDKALDEIGEERSLRVRERKGPVDGSSRFIQATILILPVAVLGCLAWTHRSMFVDGFIYLHIIQNILAGHGPVFNQGQRVEVFTSPAWTFLLAVVGFVAPWPLEWVAVVLGILLTLGGLSMAIIGSSNLVHRASPGRILLPIGAVVFVAVSPVWSLASMGLETGLTFFWLGCCFALLVRWGGSNRLPISRLALVVLGLGPLVRPELTLDSLVFMVAITLVEGPRLSWRGRIRIFAWAFAVPVIYQVFRMGYYGALVANTATAKEASLPRVGRGILYFADFVGPYWLFVPAAALLLGAYYPLTTALRTACEGRRNLMALLALPIAGSLNAAYIVVMGGDYVHARLLTPAFFAVCAPVAVVPLARRYVAALIVLPWAMVCALSLRSADANPWSEAPFVLVTGHGNVSPSGFSSRNRQWYPGSGIYVQFGAGNQTARIDAAPAPGAPVPTIASPWIGSEAFELGTGVHFLDLLGLADPLTAHLALARRGQISGHEKPLPTPWISALLTANGSSTAQLSSLQGERPSDLTPLIPVVSGRQLEVETAWARAALTCPAIHDLEVSPSATLSVGAFFSNMVHSFARTELRIPPNPESAYHRFCGPGTPAEVMGLIRGGGTAQRSGGTVAH